MTYKKMVEGIVEREACKWLESFIKNDGFTAGGTVTLTIDKGTCYFDCLVSVLGTGRIVTPVFSIGGTVDENGYVYNSVIKVPHTTKEGLTEGKLVWAATEELRNIYGITEFEI